MKHKKETIRKIIYSMRENRTSTNDYLNPSMIEKKPTDPGIKCEEVMYVVEWQMRHPLRQKISGIKFANE